MTSSLMVTLGHNQAPLTMSSLDIADLLDARHDSVKRTIERLVEKQAIAQPPLVDVQKEGGNSRSYAMQVYRLQKRDTYVVVAQLSPEFTAKLVDRWQELEAQARFQIPNFEDPIAAAEAWIEVYKQKAELEAKVQIMQPKVALVDKIVMDRDTELLVREAGRLLKVGETGLWKILRHDLNWIFRQGRRNMARSEIIRRGYMDHRVSEYECPQTERILESRTPVLKAKGMAKVQEYLAQHPELTGGA